MKSFLKSVSTYFTLWAAYKLIKYNLKKGKWVIEDFSHLRRPTVLRRAERSR